MLKVKSNLYVDEHIVEVSFYHRNKAVEISGRVIEQYEKDSIGIAINIENLSTEKVNWLLDLRPRSEILFMLGRKINVFKRNSLFIAEGFDLTYYLNYFNSSRYEKMKGSKLIIFNDSALDSFWLDKAAEIFKGNMHHYITRNPYDAKYVDNISGLIVQKHYKEAVKYIFYKGSLNLKLKLFDKPHLKRALCDLS